ncbi:hypothetical protein FQR65_LT09747 [Abscondita terminalis]|nr:hypothetical protein FQR65_LT09747 [Abscondita terminalis]
MVIQDPCRRYSFKNGYKSKVPLDYSISYSYPNHNFLNHKFRSTSHDHISSEVLQRVPITPRPSSTTPETNRLQNLNKNISDCEEKSSMNRYLTDKNPRSRKPIYIQTEGDQPTWFQKAFWGQKEDEVLHSHVTTNVFLANTSKTEEPSITV